jgi:hypothetical protein
VCQITSHLYPGDVICSREVQPCKGKAVLYDYHGNCIPELWAAHTNHFPFIRLIMWRGVQPDEIWEPHVRKQIFGSHTLGSKYFFPCLKPSYSCSSNYSKPVSVSYQSPFFIKPLKNSVRSQPGVHVNYLNVIFTGNLFEKHQGLAAAALWTLLVCADKVMT